MAFCGDFQIKFKSFEIIEFTTDFDFFNILFFSKPYKLDYRQ